MIMQKKPFKKMNKRKKIFLNGYEMWLDVNNSTLYDKENSKHGLTFDVMGSGDTIYINSPHLTKSEKIQLTNYLKNQNE